MAAAHQSSSSTLVVFGATGNQGGSVARHAAGSGRWKKIRLITRDVAKPSAQKLLEEVVKLAAGRTEVSLVNATFDDKASLVSALTGATHAFVVTNWWELFVSNKPKHGVEGFVAGEIASNLELIQGKNYVDAAKETGVQFTIFSGLEDLRPRFQHVYHFHTKGEIEKYLWANIPGAVVRLSYYLENFDSAFCRPQADHSVAFNLPADWPLPVFAVKDTGAVVDGIFSQVLQYGPQYWDKEAVGLASDKIPLKKVCELWAKAKGQPIHYKEVTSQQYASFGFPGDAELAEMFELIRDEVACARNVATTKALATARLQTTEEYFASLA